MAIVVVLAVHAAVFGLFDTPFTPSNIYSSWYRIYYENYLFKWGTVAWVISLLARHWSYAWWHALWVTALIYGVIVLVQGLIVYLMFRNGYPMVPTTPDPPVDMTDEEIEAMLQEFEEDNR